ncbi:cell division protein FtsX [Mariniphaga anaerophila]|nr:permease-like cell division protein FtsX [Mariniphaga anaerophila]
MKAPKPGKLKKRVFRSWITSTVSISLVLVLLGGLLLILANAGRLSDYVREQIGFTLVLHDDLKEVDVLRLEKVLASTDYVKSTRYIDKETAARELTEELGEDFSGFLGFNPLFASVDVKLFAPYTNSDSLAIIEKEFLEFPQVKEVYYQKDLLAVINENVKKISVFLLIVSGLTGFIFVSLINNTIRISVYSERFTINTMQLVGATRSFVRKPFLRRGVSLGVWGGLVANSLLFAGIFSFRNELEGLIKPADLVVLGYVFLLVIVLGMVISYVSTWLAVNKFLRLKFDELFY